MSSMRWPPCWAAPTRGIVAQWCETGDFQGDDGFLMLFATMRGLFLCHLEGLEPMFMVKGRFEGFGIFEGGRHISHIYLGPPLCS